MSYQQNRLLTTQTHHHPTRIDNNDFYKRLKKDQICGVGDLLARMHCSKCGEIRHYIPYDLFAITSPNPGTEPGLDDRKG